ncbi:adenine phosphoribosyltransferase [Calidifontibacter terrae]
MTTTRETLLARVRDIADFPEPGVLFKDLNPLFADAASFAEVLDDIAQRWVGQVDLVAGIEARGFILGAPLAQRMGLGFLPVRKAGKLPGETVSVSYDLEYGSATIEVPAGACDGHRVLVVDDVLATGGTAAAAVRLVEHAGGKVTGVDFLLEVGALEGRAALGDHVVHVIATV